VLLYVSYLMLRRLSPTGADADAGGGALVFAAIDVPIVFMSIRWWRTQHSAPVFLAAGHGHRPLHEAGVRMNRAGMGDVGVFLLTFRYALERRRQEREQEAALRFHRGSLEIAQ